MAQLLILFVITSSEPNQTDHGIVAIPTPIIHIADRNLNPVPQFNSSTQHQFSAIATATCARVRAHGK